ncbi:3-isopropylmalate dehydratase small subunit [Verminephrobacter eiseniae]|uniref:3-isopropylmalate dehydratase small subunit n=1 Tax=Verminephrobacter eiseniae TaxID=364317 RepID=UPI0010D14E81|nr:3-isopropylmalate dehydratase small subunit [Verminephrobacter eiseniae]KAB7598013.1 3-isopropylmalate dehydratase small subunit [Verminephrobacter sp. Larva24]MCW5230192.1 3-isopropylmalate dehydratase small subunit [Verminephrobacter eiseniae]MCW5291925.1 3-isopropylmalate dehydratase small subunit [Verminephrobacter eiseniae]MCW8184922.1 3-isopropylmalate dehydratase small subunit [Verminephrobacter eiseniae]MCW8223650.1 3-isopropylmalate dehydratase small subunit [Verminephrobacter eise
MKSFVLHRGLAVPMARANIDTDAILPKQFMKSIERTGFGVHLFDGFRYLDAGSLGMDCSRRPENPDFILNWPRYREASILLAGANFGCGSSREHAPWAIEQYGFRVLIASSFADIFRDNCFKNGLLPIVLASETMDRLFDEVSHQVGFELEVDLQRQTIFCPAGWCIEFEMDSVRKAHLLEGIDEIGSTLSLSKKIGDFERARRQSHPWFFGA